MLRTDRRSFLQGAAGFAAAGLPLIGGARNALAQSAPISWPMLTPGFTVLLVEFIQYHKLDEKNGFKLPDPIVYTSVPTYYGDVVAGNLDIAVGSWDSFAVRYAKGVPIRQLCTISTGKMINFMSAKGTGVDKIEDIRGKTVAAPQSTGTYRVSKAVLQQMRGIDLEGEATVQNVTNPAGSVALLRAGSADAALTWEPNVTQGMADDPNLQTIFNVGEAYAEKMGRDLPYFSVVVTEELLKREPGIGAKVDGMFRDCINGILGDVDSAVQIVGDRAGYKPEVLKEAITSGRLSFKFGSMTDPKEVETVKAAAEFFVANGLMDAVPDDGFFVTS